jgi:hypothetical protein
LERARSCLAHGFDPLADSPLGNTEGLANPCVAPSLATQSPCPPPAPLTPRQWLSCRLTISGCHARRHATSAQQVLAMHADLYTSKPHLP